MSVYFVEPHELLGEPALVAEVARHEPVVGQLIRRFDLAGTTLMSVGSGIGYAEAAFLQGGIRRAFLFDIDEHGTLEPRLRHLHRPERPDTPFTFFIEDFVERSRRPDGLPPIDFLYVSSFTPDEMRREEIAAAHRRLAAAGADLDPDWPAETSPVHEAVLAAIDRCLEPGGFFILQSSYAGVDVLRNPGYVRQWARTLEEHEVTLLESYCFRAAPGVTLWIGVKERASGGDAGALAARLALSTRPPLTRFHARAELTDCSISQVVGA